MCYMSQLGLPAAYLVTGQEKMLWKRRSFPISTSAGSSCQSQTRTGEDESVVSET